MSNYDDPRVEEVFSEFVSAYKEIEKAKLVQKKEFILQQAFFNLGFSSKAGLSEIELGLLSRELSTIVYTMGNGFAKFFPEGHELESLSDTPENSPKWYAKNARNLLRHIVCGTPFGEDGAAFSDSPLAIDLNKTTLFETRDPALMQAMREQMQCTLAGLFQQLSQLPQNSEAEEKQLEILLSNLLAAYPFIDPTPGEEVHIPQKINQQWKMVKYRFERIDISPQTGPFSWLLEDEDRIYAYGLVPVEENTDAQPICLLMGTTYPAGQGHRLADLNNLTPWHSIGESHDMSLVDAWLTDASEKHGKVKVTGHSKGATMANILAARHPEKISQADCLNPMGLSDSTIQRLNQTWLKTPKEKRPIINIYAQQGDPVFPSDNGFLEGTNIYHIIPIDDKCSMNFKGIEIFDGLFHIPVPKFLLTQYEAHIHHFAGRGSIVLKGNAKQENLSLYRVFMADFKTALSVVAWPLKAAEFFFELCGRKIGRWYSENKIIIHTALFLLAAVFVFGFPVGLPIPTLIIAALVAGAITTLVVPKFVEIVSKAIGTLGLAVGFTLTLISAGLGSLISGAKIGFKSMFFQADLLDVEDLRYEKIAFTPGTAIPPRRDPSFDYLTISKNSEVPIDNSVCDNSLIYHGSKDHHSEKTQTSIT